MIAVEEGKDSGDLLDVDFSESVDVLSDEEQRAKWDWELSKGLIDLADILMQKNPDLTREEAEDYLFDRRATEIDDIDEEDTPSSNPLLDILNTPTE